MSFACAVKENGMPVTRKALSIVNFSLAAVIGLFGLAIAVLNLNRGIWIDEFITLAWTSPANSLREFDVRVGIDSGNDRIQAKVKVAADEKVPYMLIVGPRDAETNSVSVRARGTEKDLGAMPLDKFVADLKSEISNRRAELSVKP